MTLQEIGFLDKNFYKTNYLETLKIITPKVYLEEDMALSGQYLDPLADIINKHIQFVANANNILHISATSNFSSINTINGLSPYFIKQNGLTLIDPIIFERQILNPLGFGYVNFDTSTDFKAFLDSTILPDTRLGVNSTIFATTPSANHEYLINNLGLFYLLNTSCNGLTSDPSSFISQKYTDVIYKGNTLGIDDGIQILNYILWNNQNTSSLFRQYIPSNYLSSINPSGLQQLNTLTNIVYNTLQSDNSDNTVKNAFQNYIDAGVLLNTLDSAGPFERLLKAFSFGIYDVNSNIELLNTLLDVDRCPNEFLPLLAHMIGWRLVSNNPEKWRLQLRLATTIYKAKGTKKALQAAINTIIPTAIFDPVSGIIELYESYIPYLIYYSLLTESFLFADGFNSWTPDIAQSLGVADFTTKSFDQNVRYAVDYIILDLVRKFPNLFYLAGTPWNLADPNFIFKYRDRLFPIPPWEEIKYYEHQFITNDLLQELIKVLSCFGVDTGYLDNLLNYIEQYTIKSGATEITYNNAWLFFTPSSINPPNFAEIISDSSRNRIEYMTLWNGKSSHFRLVFTASSINFNSVNYDASSFLSVITASRFINEFSPFHSIPEILLFINLLVDAKTYSDNFCTTFIYPVEFEVAFPSGMAYGGPEFSGVNMSASGHHFSKGDVDNIADLLMSDGPSGAPALSNLGRRSIRRRDYFHLLKRSGHFHRTGFDMPSPNIMDLSTGAYASYLSSYIPLGLIPSTLEFASAIASSLGIYDYCEGYNASDSFYGYNVSNTFPCRGLETITTSTCDRYVDRGQTPQIIQTMYSVGLRRELNKIASSIPDFFPGGLPTTIFSSFYNLPESFQAIIGTFPSSLNEYYSFSFGDGMHRFYRDFTSVFRKNIITNQSSNGGFDIFSHAYGPLLYNGTLFIQGSALAAHPEFAASTFNNAIPINYNNGTGVLSKAGIASGLGTYLVSSFIPDYFIIRPEFRNANFISGVEFIDTSGAAARNNIEIFNIDQAQARFLEEDFFVRNPLIKVTALNGAPRLRFNLSAYGPSRNTLIPEHNFNLNINVLPGTYTGDQIGGSILGVWLHTGIENGVSWSYNFDKNLWISTPYTLLSSLAYINNNLAKLVSFPLATPTFPGGNNTIVSACYENVTIQGTVINGVGNIPIIQANFTNVGLSFNTMNSKIIALDSYSKTLGPVHRLNQNYILDIFTVPNITGNYYQIFDEISIIDVTENNRVSEYTQDEVTNVVRFFNYCSEGPGSRYAPTTSGMFDVSGGSRINYRIHPEWTPHSTSGGTFNGAYTSIDISQ
jgi:phage tail-like protein